MGERVVVAMSGGVDSSVAAALLLERGYEVIGLTFRFWLCEEQTGTRSCCGMDGVNEARRATGQLGVPHYVVDCREAFERIVLRPAWEEYARGRTPNPCVVCNERIKFALLLEQGRKLGASRLATGHYARIEEDPAGGPPLLLRGADGQKDQSYFLFSLTAEQRAQTLTPLGGLTKAEVRDLARRLGLPNAERKESQDACLGTDGVGFAETLRVRFREPSRPGRIVDPAGLLLGAHEGVHRFTVGQRRGLGVALGKRAYILSIDAAQAKITVSIDENDLWATGLRATHLRFTDPARRTGENRGEVQIRYRHAPAPARIELTCAEEALIRFDEPQRAVTPGQAAVFYRGPRVLGGGWIAQAIR
jgi:tRNA-specific 2-thiouridylase